MQDFVLQSDAFPFPHVSAWSGRNRLGRFGRSGTARCRIQRRLESAAIRAYSAGRSRCKCPLASSESLTCGVTHRKTLLRQLRPGHGAGLFGLADCVRSGEHLVGSFALLLPISILRVF